MGRCDIENGYYGVMCDSCLPGFSSDGPHKCRKCSEWEFITIPVLVILMIVGIVILVRMALKGAIQ